MKKYAIVVTCEPYHAKIYYHGEPYVGEPQKDGRHPWLADTDTVYDTMKEAKEALWKMAYEKWANTSSNVTHYESIDDYFEHFADCTRNETPTKKSARKWFKGEGLYRTCDRSFIWRRDDLNLDFISPEPVLIKGDDYYEDDVLTYSIEKVNERTDRETGKKTYTFAAI